MQKRVRKNSEYIWAKKPKLDLPPNNDQEKTDTTAAPSQFAHTKEIDKKSEQFVRNVSSSDCNDFSDVNIVEKPSSSSSSLNSVMKTFSKSDSDSIELKEVFKQIMNDGENDDHLLCSDTTSDSPNKNITNLLIHENSEATQDSSLITKSENESSESLSTFKLLHRENDILIDFNTNTRMSDTTNNHNVPDGNSICIPTENELFLTDSSNSKDQPIMSTKKQMESLVMNTKVVEDPNVPKSNAPPTLLNCNLSVSNVATLEMNAANEKKKLLPDQTTAKVSIGDTTISVPLLKPLNSRRIITNEGKSVPNIVSKVINIRGKKIKAPTILQFSQVQLNPKTNAKIVQATLVGNKIQLPNNIGLKISQGFIKSNLVQTSQCSGMTVTSLPKQIFDDEMVFVEKTTSNPQSQSQNQSQTVEDYDAKAIETLPANNSINKSTVKPKEMNNKTIATEDQVQKSNSSYLTQLCVIETDAANALPKSFENTITDMTQSSISVASSCESTLSKVTATVSKLSRKPIMVTKTVSASELLSGTMNSTIDALSNQTKDNQQQMTDKPTLKMLENNPLLRRQIALTVQNCNRFQPKTSKSTDDMKLKAKERIGEAIGIGPPKRQMTKIGSIVVQNPTTEANQSMITSVDKDKQSNQAKSEEPQNVLLKHLLQSSSNQRSNTTCNTTLAPRKLAPVRAPSLGVVSSLEAQLARPVMPPVSSVGEMKPELKLQTKLMNDKLKKNLNDRENINIAKSRPEIISRETSFVSTFSPRNKPPQTTSTPPEYERMTSMPSSTSHTIEIDGPKTAPVQTNSMTNSNNHAINLFKFFKQQEQEKSPTIETNANHMHNQVSSPDIGTPDNKLNTVTKSEYDNLTLDVASSSAMKSKLTKMEIDQNIEMRKRLKREYQKQKRQVLLNKEPQNHQKKKSRKLSKASEDFDEFIENKVVQMKQMFVLEVLEPLLSTFLGICSIYGHNERIRNHVEYSQHNGSKDEFGRTNLKNLVDFYSMKPYGPHPNNKVSNKPSFQNKFYDEEFSTINHESCDKLYHFIHNLKQQSLQPADNTALITHSPCKATRNQINNSYPYRSFPGIKFQRSYNLNADRMSPVIPLIHPNSFGSMKRKKPIHTSRHKHTLAAMDTTVILTLSSFVAENLLDILRDLEKLLNTYSPVSHKLLNNDKVNVSNIKGVYISRIRNLQRTETTNIQNFLNGTYKCCRNCHLTIICGIVGADSNLNIKKKILADSHFCDKFCCIQYKKKGRKFIVSRKKERCYPNNVSANNKITTNESNCCNTNNSNYKVVSPNCFWRPTHKTLANDDVNENILKMRIAITLSNGKDTRRCILCNQKGDAFADGSSRLLNYDVNKWVHLNCALWSNSVYETINGGLMNLELTMQQGLHQICSFCNQYGATIKCFKIRCGHIYHLPCAIKEQCVFYKNKTIHCASHAHRMEKKNELNSIRVRRRVYIERDENRQVAAVMHHLELSNLLRIGNLTFINVGQLLPHQLEAFHTPNYIYPIGYKIIRFFWSMKKLNKRCRYICSIVETNGRPEFVIQVQESFEGDVELRDISPKAVWQRVLDKIAQLRRGQPLVQLFTEFFTGEDLFGLSEPSIVRILESLPGVESLTDYRFKYGRNPLLELPLALNPSGSARTEPKQRHIINWKKAHTQRTSSINLKLSLSPSSLVAGEVACPYSKQFVHSKSSQYRKMKQEWRNNVYLARSKIQGLGLYAARDLEKHTMVIEYIGQVIRTEVSELREKQYDLRNRGIYMFRLDEERVVDATLSGGLARYINHSCNPNCVTEIVDVDREYRIIIFAKRRINKGEELSYDYKFDIEDDAHKISCMCDAPNCRKWMN